MSEKKTCCAKVYEVGFPHGAMACGKTAKYERDGKWYCATHDPVKIKERRDKRHASNLVRWLKEAAERKEAEAEKAERERRADCFDDLLSALEWALSNINCEPYEWVDEDNCNAHQAAIAAIAKARGETE